MTQRSVWKETGVYYQGSNLGGMRALLLGALLSHKTQNFSCSPQNYKPKPHPEVPHFLSCPVWSLSQPLNQISTLSGMCACGSQSHHLLQQPSPSGPGVRCSQPPHSGPGPTCCTALDHSVLEAGGQRGTHPSMGPSLQE